MAREIAATTRSMNALEHVVPRLERERDRIALVLEEREREDAERHAAGDRAESMVAVNRLERVLEERLDVRARADARVREAEREAKRLVAEGRERGRAAAEDVRRTALEAAERDAAVQARETDAETAALHARALRGRQDAVETILAAVLPRVR